MMLPEIPGPIATVITGCSLMVAALSLGIRYKLTSHKFPNYPGASRRQRFVMAVLGLLYAFLSVYRLNSPLTGGFEMDTGGAVVSLWVAAYHGNEAYELLRSRLPAYFWRTINRAKSLARCGRRKRRGPALGVLTLSGFSTAAPLEKWHPSHEELMQ